MFFSHDWESIVLRSAIATRDKKAEEQTQEGYAERKLWSFKTFIMLQTLSFCTWKRIKQAWMSGAEEHTCEKHIYAPEPEWI